MAFIRQFFKDNKEIKAEDIELFVSQKIEENVNLDYTDIKAYEDVNGLSVSIASFANSEGGLIILGISEDKIVDEKGKIKRIYPKKITWGNVSLDKESLENKVVSRIKPSITNLVIKPIRNEKNKVIFLIDIPKSNIAPHMSFDYRYHRRINFGTRVMEHYEIANLFKINWTMREKIIEKIYEPSLSILEKHAKQLNEYSCPFGHELEEILSRTYYKAQIPMELLEKIEYYIDQINDLDKKEYHARKAILNIVSKNVVEYLKKEYHLPNNEALSFNFGTDLIHVFTKSRTHHIDFDVNKIYKNILTNQKIQTYMDSVYWQYAYAEILLHYSNKDYYLKLDEFDELVWKKCLKEALKNAEIIEMKEFAEDLLEQAWDLIDEMTRY